MDKKAPVSSGPHVSIQTGNHIVSRPTRREMPELSIPTGMKSLTLASTLLLALASHLDSLNDLAALATSTVSRCVESI